MESMLFKILIFMFPGFVSVSIISFLNNKKYCIYDKIINSYIISMVSYLVFKSLIIVVNKDNTSLNIFKLSNVYILTFIGIIIGIVFFKFKENGFIYSLIHKLGITYNTGYPTVIENIYKSNDVIPKYLRQKYVCIRLLDETVKYDGFISFYEAHDGYIEILLTGNNDMESSENVYISYGDIQNEEKAVYLTLINGTFTIEFRE